MFSQAASLRRFTPKISTSQIVSAPRSIVRSTAQPVPVTPVIIPVVPLSPVTLVQTPIVTPGRGQMTPVVYHTMEIAKPRSTIISRPVSVIPKQGGMAPILYHTMEIVQPSITTPAPVQALAPITTVQPSALIQTAPSQAVTTQDPLSIMYVPSSVVQESEPQAVQASIFDTPWTWVVGAAVLFMLLTNKRR
ncbi:MAG: hypothetical protein ABIG95_02455 [Candidatus Woesearchaeota archaeon]